MVNGETDIQLNTIEAHPSVKRDEKQTALSYMWTFDCCAMMKKLAFIFMTVNISAIYVFIMWRQKDSVYIPSNVKQQHTFPDELRYFGSLKQNQLDGSADSLSRKEYLNEQCRQPLLGLVTDLATHRRTVEHRILVDATYNIGYCNVPKVGSTFWYSAFAILASNSSISDSPFSISEKYKADVQQNVKVKYFFQLSPTDRRKWYNNSNLFLFVRDPYARMFSAYLDKFYRPNNYYWRHSGRRVVKFTRSHASAKSLKCGHDVTFEEFLKFFIASETSDRQFTSDHHWTPIYKLCSPCHYNYGFIGKTETFVQDTKLILNATHTTGKVQFQPADNDVVAADFTRKINLHLNHYLQVRECINATEAVRRLWFILKSTGYLKQGAEPPELKQSLNSSNVKDGENVLFDAAMKQYKVAAFPGSQQQLRQDALRAAYRGISTNILRSVREILLPDFLLFGYDPFPAYIYDSSH